MKQSIFIRAIIIPSAVFISVMFGGSYGTGREIVEFVSQNGPMGGLVSMGVIAVTYAMILFLCFELGRLYQVYEYRGLSRTILGKGWFLYEILIMIAMLIALAICTSAADAIAVDHFGLPKLTGGLGLLMIVTLLNYFGRDFVERAMVLAVCLLALVFLYLFYKALGTRGDQISQAFATSEPVQFSSVKSGLIYALGSGGFIPVILYCARDLNSRSDTTIAAIFAGGLVMVPAVFLHLAFMTVRPGIYDEILPAYWLVETVTSPAFLNIYVGTVFIMVALTGVGLLHGFIERIDKWRIGKTGAPLSKIGHGITAGSALILSSLFASMGLVALILKAYSFLSIAFLIVFFLPLFTIGAYKIFNLADSVESQHV